MTTQLIDVTGASLDGEHFPTLGEVASRPARPLHHRQRRRHETLYYIASNLNLDDTPMENWKILIARTK